MTVIVLNANMKSLVALIDMRLSNSKSGCLLPSRSSLLFTAAKTLTSVSCATRQVVTHLGHDEVPNFRNTLQHFLHCLGTGGETGGDVCLLLMILYLEIVLLL